VIRNLAELTNSFWRDQSRGKKTLFHFATGGVSHFLIRLGRSINFARDAGWRIAVVTEFHQPLGKLSFHEIFDASDPIQRLAKFSRLRGELDLDNLRSHVQYRSDDYAIASISDQVGRRSFPAYLPPASPAPDFAFTTGDIQPGAPRPGRAAGWLASISSISLAEYFSKVVADRAASIEEPYIAVHFRNSDRLGNINETLQMLRQRTQATGLETVWWCTDDRRSIDQAIEAMPRVKFICAQNYFLGNKRNLHDGLQGQDSVAQLQTTFADLFTLFAAEEYIPATESGWNRLVPLLRREKDAAMRFFGFG